MSKVGNKYIITIKSEAEIDGKMKYWVDKLENMCIDNNVLSKLELYKEVPKYDVKAGDVVRLGEFGETDYLVTRVEDGDYKNPTPILHLMNLNNGTVQTNRGRFRIVEAIGRDKAFQDLIKNMPSN